MIVVHHLERSRSQRVLWLLEELGQPYELVRYARDAKTMLAPPELAQIHPLGKAPIVVDDGLVLAETSAILDTLLQRHGAGRFQPQTDEQTIAYRYWMPHPGGRGGHPGPGTDVARHRRTRHDHEGR